MSLQEKINYFIKNSENAPCKKDQTIICQKRNIPQVRLPNFITNDEEETRSSFYDFYEEWYPYVNSFYHYTEDVDAFARVNHLLSFRGEIPPILPNEIPIKHCYSEQQAQQEYLESTPLSFLILGKPGIGEEDLGKALAEFWKGVYIDPEILIREEIGSGSRAGKCIEFNLRCGRAIGIDVILRLVKKRVCTQSVLHRGFILCGLPVIPNNLFEEDPVSSESAVFNVQEIFDELLDTVIENADSQRNVSVSSKGKKTPETVVEEEPEPEDVAEEEEPEQVKKKRKPKNQEEQLPLDIGDPQEIICAPPDIGTDYEAQLNFIFELFTEPFLIIYISCDNEDVVKKRADYRFDATSQTSIDLQKEKTNKVIFDIFNREPGYNINKIADDFFEAGTFGVDSSKLEYLVKLPGHFPVNVRMQLDRFHQIASRLIEKQILVHKPEYYIKLDGRTTTGRMFNILKWRLRILPVQKVVLPEKLNVMPEGVAGEETGPFSYNVKGLTFEECMVEFSKRQVASRQFRWSLSDWGTKCPVQMYEGIMMDGDKNFAVHFMNKIFFLSSQEAFIKFYRNPRPYLLPPAPKCNLKILIFGPNYSGKTAIAQCLSYLLNGTALSVIEMEQKYKDDRHLEILERIKQAKLNEGIIVLDKAREDELDLKRETANQAIKDWFNECEQYLEYYMEELNSEDITLDALSSFPQKLGRSKEELHKRFSLMNPQDLNLPLEIMTNRDLCTSLLKDDCTKLKEYTPPWLLEAKTTAFKENVIPATVLDEFVLNYAEEAVHTADVGDIDLSEDDILGVFSSSIQEVEEAYMAQGNIRGGWIIDGMPTEFNIVEKVCERYRPDHVIVLRDPTQTFLATRPRDANVYTEFKNLLEELGKKEAALRAPSDESTISFKMRIMREMLTDILDKEQFMGSKEEKSSAAAYATHLTSFDQQWETISVFFKTAGIDPMEIDVSEKTMSELLKLVIKKFEDRYRQTPTVMTEEDRAEEVQVFGEGGVQDEEVAEGAGNLNTADLLEDNRYYGDTYAYCPVAYHTNWVLWKGKEEFAVKFLDKVYVMSSESAMKSFMFNAYNFLPLHRPLFPFPPPRFCVVGTTGSGKTSLAKALSKNYGLCYVNFATFLEAEKMNLLNDELHINEEENVTKGSEDKSDAMPVGDPISLYIASGQPLPEKLLAKFLNKLWKEDPFRSIGFVIDEFPKRPSDINFMKANYLIPDMVFELSGVEKQLKARILAQMIQDWQLKIDAAKHAYQIENHGIIDQWEQARNQRFQQLMEQRRQQRYSMKKKQRGSVSQKPKAQPQQRPYLEDLPETDEETDRSSFRTKSQVSFNSVDEQKDIDEVNKQVAEEIPEPIYPETFETLESATERLKNFYADNYALDFDHINATRDLCKEELIPWIKINALANAQTCAYEAFIHADKIKFRNNSFFERCYEVSIEVAERLLSSGYCFISKIGRTCPVQYHDKSNPMQLFIPNEQKFNIFPIIHRQYIYFIVGKKSRETFKKDPLKYTSFNQVRFPLLTSRVGVIGPPKCGKSALCERFRNELGFKIVTRGQAARYVLSYISHSALAINMEETLRQGLPLTDEMTMRAVEAASFDPRVATQGVVFDGFPCSNEEVKYLSDLGLMPHIIIDLNTDDPTIYRKIADDAVKLYDPPYSRRFIRHRFRVWGYKSKYYRRWMHTEFQNVYSVKIDSSMWHVWTNALNLTLVVFSEVKDYFNNAREDVPLMLTNMLVSPLEFLERQSGYKTFCPCCLHFTKSLRNGGVPVPNRNGLVHFRKYFYWVCPQHLSEFIINPEIYLPPQNNNKMPQDLPEKIILDKIPDDVHEEGYCTVCYFHIDKPVKGNIKYAAKYREKIYLFDSDECLEKFIESPETYYNVNVILKGKLNYPALKYRELPVLGMLEQYVATPIVKAINSTVTHRPVVPGLSVSQSALMQIGLYLKLNNKNTPEEYLSFYKEGYEKFHNERLELMQYLGFMQRYRNPYLYYEEPMPPMPSDPLAAILAGDLSTENKSERASEVSIIEEAADVEPDAESDDYY